MTEEQVNKGKAILDEIKSLEKDCKDLDELIKYVARKEGDYAVQTHESWISTPYAKVNRTNFCGFLESEKNRIEFSIQSLKEKLESL